MRISEVSRRYSRALYDSAKENKTAELVLSELKMLEQAIASDKSIAEFIKSPVVPSNEKITVLKNSLTAKVSPELAHFVLLLAENSRLNLLTEIAKGFEEITDEGNGVVRGLVRSAAALSAESRKKIEETVTKVTKKKVILSFTEDAKLLGGMVAQVGGWTFDDSLDSHLIRLGEDLKRRAN